MEAFPLCPLPPHLLERIVTKCEWISYFRLQQTCHYIDELVRTSLDIKNIKIYPANLPTYALFLEKDSHDLDELRLKFYVYKGPIDVKCPYGIRFKELRPENYDNFENYCDALKRHRVTSSQMIVRHFQKLTKEECVILLKILKPTEVDLDSNGSNRFEAILEAKQLENVSFMIDLDDAMSNDSFMIKQIISRYPKLNIHVDAKEMERQFRFFRRMMLFLRSSPLPDLIYFNLHGTFARRIPQPRVRTLLERFDDFNPTFVTKVKLSPTPKVWEYHFNCTLGGSIPSCRLLISDNHLDIHFEPVAVCNQPPGCHPGAPG